MNDVSLYPIRQVMVYEGHKKNPLLGPYAHNIEKRIQMFHALNPYRKEQGRLPWKVSIVSGEEIIDALDRTIPEETLLVIPAGQTSHLDSVFSSEQIERIHKFFLEGGRGYFTCGAAYWVSNERIYTDLCAEHPEEKKVLPKKSRLPLFQGTARGPLCPYPGKKYKVGFYSDAVQVTDSQKTCTIFLSGGGSFSPDKSGQKIRVLARYPEVELHRLKKPKEETKMWEAAAILISVRKGAAVLSMFHPYYGGTDIDAEAYERNFPDCGTDWRVVQKNLSSTDLRMRFVLNAILIPLEDMDWGGDS